MNKLKPTNTIAAPLNTGSTPHSHPQVLRLRGECSSSHYPNEEAIESS